jgi:hypothetical protein
MPLRGREPRARHETPSELHDLDARSGMVIEPSCSSRPAGALIPQSDAPRTLTPGRHLSLLPRKREPPSGAGQTNTVAVLGFEPAGLHAMGDNLLQLGRRSDATTDTNDQNRAPLHGLSSGVISQGLAEALRQGVEGRSHQRVYHASAVTKRPRPRA